MVGKYIQDCLSRKLLFFTGKGGVGKTSLALATALACQRRGKNVIYCSWSPLDVESPPALLEREGIEWVPLTAQDAFKEYALKILRFEKVYETIFENPVLKTFVLAAPGLSETVVAGKIWDLHHHRKHDLIIVDLPSSGHAYSFFHSPLGVKRIFRLGFVYKEALKIIGMFESPETRLDFVGIPEEMSVEENSLFYQKLKKLATFSFGFLHMNQCLPHFEEPSSAALAHLPQDVLECLEHHRIQKKAEQEAQEHSRTLPFSVQEIPRFAVSTEEEVVTKIAAHLEHL